MGAGAGGSVRPSAAKFCSAVLSLIKRMYRAPDVPAIIIFKKNSLNSSQNLPRCPASSSFSLPLNNPVVGITFSLYCHPEIILAMNYFAPRTAAQRYAKGRPDVHAYTSHQLRDF